MRFKEGPNHRLENNGKTAVKTGARGWNTNAIGDWLLMEGTHEWGVRMSGDPNRYIMVGVAPLSINVEGGDNWNVTGGGWYVAAQTLHELFFRKLPVVRLLSQIFRKKVGNLSPPLGLRGVGYFFS